MQAATKVCLLQSVRTRNRAHGVPGDNLTAAAKAGSRARLSCSIHSSCKLARPARLLYCPYAQLHTNSSHARESLPACAPASDMHTHGNLNIANGAAAHLADATTSRWPCSPCAQLAKHHPASACMHSKPMSTAAPAMNAAELAAQAVGSDTVTSDIAAIKQADRARDTHRYFGHASPACGNSFAS
jgi:hypothetical protein